MSKNEFDCLTNALLQASLRIGLPVAFAVPERVRDILEGADVKDVKAVLIHQRPTPKGIIDYKIEVYMKRGLMKLETFQGSGFGQPEDTYVLYDCHRDGRMKHLHLLH